jgi:succinoglycan biosynthesis protein ExoM
MPRLPHISVCICTYKRPEMLGRLLSKIEEQETAGLFDFSIVIADNDCFESARPVGESFEAHSSIPVAYHVEPEQNIALVRNKALANARGEFVAFIDDDEFPVKHWLLNLYQAVRRYDSDGVLGPVLAHFQTRPPEWVLKGHFFDRPSHPTGHILHWKNTRTGNALLRLALFRQSGAWFDPAYGSGGEDRDFFRRKIEAGHLFAWCNEAPVFETVPPKRWKRSVLLKRALLRGKMALNNTGSRPVSVLRSMAAIVVYTGCLPLFFMLGHHIFMQYLINGCDHLGKVLAAFSIDLVKDRYVGG